jgi:hypothetical protein
VSAAPAPPKPAAAPAPAPPPEPLSIPQTNVHLSPPQPLTPEAIATTQLPGEPPPTPAQPPRPQPKRPQPARPVVEPPPAAVPAAPPAPSTAEPGRAPITEVLAPAELKRLQDEAGTRVLETRKVLAQITRARRRAQQTTVSRVETFLKQAEEAERRGDMRQASELAGRALVLARELKP